MQAFWNVLPVNQTTEPKLDPPGAGLPAPVLFVAKRLFAVKCKLGNRETFVATFRNERAKIRALVDSVPVQQRKQRILVPRLRGLEDSSRYYSVWMTLDHLRITNKHFAHFVTELSHGRVPDVEVGTAGVKPDPAVTKSVDAEYEETCENFLTEIEALPELSTAAELTHPWFGSMNSYQWLALSGMHMGIHRAQISAIMKRLR